MHRFFNHLSYTTYHSEYERIVSFLGHYLAKIDEQCPTQNEACFNNDGLVVPCSCTNEFAFLADILKMAVKASLAAAYLEMGNSDAMITAFQKSLTPEKYSVVRRRREQWERDRAILQKRLKDNRSAVKIHFAAFASQSRVELESLILSANISQINLDVSFVVVVNFDDKACLLGAWNGKAISGIRMQNRWIL